MQETGNVPTSCAYAPTLGKKCRAVLEAEREKTEAGKNTMSGNSEAQAENKLPLVLYYVTSLLTTVWSPFKSSNTKKRI